MEQGTKIRESVLYEVWKNHNFKKSFKTLEGIEIVVLDCGTINDQFPGPDFKNARVRIGNLTYVGDVEIDSTYTDWKAHGHHIDSKYSKVILHASLVNKSNQDSVYTRDGRKIPSICISEYVDKKFIEELNKEVDEQSIHQYSSLKCYALISSVSQELKVNYLLQLGIQRFEKKCKKIYQRLKELQFLDELDVNEPVVSYDLSDQFHKREFNYSDFSSTEVWQQLLYELIFEALGYNKNKNQMRELAKNANIKFMSKIENDGITIEKYEAALFNISGLFSEEKFNFDDEARIYLDRLSLHWNSIQPFYDSKFFDESTWNFFRTRPQNFPTVRIAGGARIIFEILHNDLIKSIVKKISEINNVNMLANSLRATFIIKADGFWKNHYVIDEKTAIDLNFFVGSSRADEIMVNIILPYFSVYFDVFGDKELSKKILKVYSIYMQSMENQIITDVSESLDIGEGKKNAILTQGMLELFRSLCSKNRCLECEIGKTVFN